MVVAMFLNGCLPTIEHRLDDRLTYKTIEKIEAQEYCGPPLSFKLDDKSIHLKIVDLPDGFTGGGRENSFTIGETFNAYLQQASRIAFQKNAGVIPAPVQVTIADAKLSFTNDAMAAWDLAFVIDWALLKLTTINSIHNSTREVQTEKK